MRGEPRNQKQYVVQEPLSRVDLKEARLCVHRRTEVSQPWASPNPRASEKDCLWRRNSLSR